ncbi:MAG: efflux RND transporter periplasmic adaptor subunit [Vicinamibacterales bacterium]
MLTLPLAAAACGADHAPVAGPAASPVDAATAPVTRTPRPEWVEAGGVIGATSTATVAARLVADVSAVLVAPGDRVRQGQPLVRLDDRDVRAAAARARAGAEASGHAGDAADAELIAARAALGLAEASHRRIAGLRDKRAATDQEFDEAAARLAGARARVTAAEAQVAGARAAAESARAAAGAADVAASYAAILAPFDGVVTEKLVEPGNQVAPGVPLVRIEGGRPRVEVTLDASRVPAVSVGDTVSVLVDGDEAVDGTVAEVARAAEVMSQAVRVKVDLPADVSRRTGRFATVRFQVGTRDALTVPETSLRRAGQITQVFVADDGAARLRLVSAGVASGGRVEILAGLAEGERVVTAPPPGLVDGTPLAGAGARP